MAACVPGNLNKAPEEQGCDSAKTESMLRQKGRKQRSAVALLQAGSALWECLGSAGTPGLYSVATGILDPVCCFPSPPICAPAAQR